MTTDAPRPGHLSVVPEPESVGIIDRMKSIIMPPDPEPDPVSDAERSEAIAVLERRQADRYDHLAQIQKIIDMKQLEIDNLKRQR